MAADNTEGPPHCRQKDRSSCGRRCRDDHGARQKALVERLGPVSRGPSDPRIVIGQSSETSRSDGGGKRKNRGLESRGFGQMGPGNDRYRVSNYHSTERCSREYLPPRTLILYPTKRSEARATSAHVGPASRAGRAVLEAQACVRTTFRFIYRIASAMLSLVATLTCSAVICRPFKTTRRR